MTDQARIAAQRTLAELAAERAGASRVFLRHGLDFCCHGRVSLAAACEKSGLSVAAISAELDAEEPRHEPPERWESRPLEELVAHILERFHAAHRAELPELLAMARKVERVHADKAGCPSGLGDHLEAMETSLEAHMQKEERVLFPLLAAGGGRTALAPVQAMEREHDDHGRNLARLRHLTNDFDPPADACGTWRALYVRLAEFESEVMRHIHLENHVLFPRALDS